MASSLTLQDTANFATQYVSALPMSPGINSEPAITAGNTILCAVLSPPFSWAWNRNSASFNTVQGTQDYAVGIADFRWVESVSISSASGTFEITHVNLLPKSSEQLGRPANISTQLDDNGGNITFRLSPVPDGVYACTVTYQKKATLIASLANTWSPIPDEYSFIYNYGFLSLMMAFADDPRFQVYNQKFVSSLLSVAQGLTDSARNIFIGNWTALTTQQQVAGAKAQQGVQVRGGL